MSGLFHEVLPILALVAICTRWPSAHAAKISHAGEHLHKGAPVKDKMPWYNTGDEIHQALHELTGDCRGANAELSTEYEGSDLGMDVFTVRGLTSTPTTKAMLVFGEHARELISPESALNFARTLCGHGSMQLGQRVDSVLNNVEFVLIPNANPIARKQVESGAYCKRTNEDGVDLNRNWGDDHRDESMAGQGDETDPGPRGFSEKETQVLKRLVSRFSPDIYLSIHSGAYLLGEPYGYTQQKTPKEASVMSEVLGPISAKYCNGQCPYGGLAKMIDYANGGCDIDYVYETLGTPYVFTWEIYTGDRYREGYIEKAQEINAEAKGRRSFLQRSKRSKMAIEEPEYSQEVDECIDQFLPKTRESTQQVVENWSGAYLELAAEVVKRRQPTS